MQTGNRENMNDAGFPVIFLQLGIHFGAITQKHRPYQIG